ncbi:MAG: condensation domain-containing protein, partial [Acidobacteria bacterium]|nr:condensation domain-containing protein [Acidobacteriota bacterium]
YYPMSSAQKRMYIVNQLEKDSISYNMPAPMIIEGNVDAEKLAVVFRELINRQEGLRTKFVVVGGEPVQRIEEKVVFEIEKLGDRQKNTEEIIKNFVRPFDLSKVPLMRVGLAKLEEEKYLFMVDFHHIIGDGVSLGVLVKEFMQLYEGKSTPPLRVQYHDYAVWQQAMVESGELKKQEEYWLKQMSTGIPSLDLPLDYPRPAMMSFEGRWLEFEIPAAITAKLKKPAELHDATLYMVLLAAYNVLLHKYTGQETIVVGSAIAGRSHPDLENIVGVFLNTLVMKNNLSGDLTFDQFLKNVRENALRAYENQDFQFEELVEKLNLKRDYSRNPIFDTMLNFINMDIPEIKLKDLKLSPYKMEGAAVKFDFKINAWEQDGLVRCTLDYCTKLFKPETMDTFIENFLKVITKVIDDPGIKIAEISLVSKDVEKEIINDFNEDIAVEF